MSAQKSVLDRAVRDVEIIAAAYKANPTEELKRQFERKNKQVSGMLKQSGKRPTDPTLTGIRGCKPKEWVAPKWAARDAWPEAAFRVWHYLEAGWVADAGKVRPSVETVAARAVGTYRGHRNEQPKVDGQIAVAFSGVKRSGQNLRLHWQAEALADADRILSDHWPAVAAVADGLRNGRCGSASATERVIEAALREDDNRRQNAHRPRSMWAQERARAN